MPPLTALQAYVLIGETLSLFQIGGMALAAVGVFLTHHGEKSPAAEPHQAR